MMPSSNCCHLKHFTKRLMTEPDILQTILKDSNYNLSLFTKDELAALRKKIFLKPDGIAEAFIAWAKQEGLSFWS